MKRFLDTEKKQWFLVAGLLVLMFVFAEMPLSEFVTQLAVMFCAAGILGSFYAIWKRRKVMQIEATKICVLRMPTYEMQNPDDFWKLVKRIEKNITLNEVGFIMEVAQDNQLSILAIGTNNEALLTSILKNTVKDFTLPDGSELNFLDVGERPI